MDSRSTPSTPSGASATDPNASMAAAANPSQPKTVGHYQLGEALGRGAAGVVYKALNMNGGEFVAIKQIPMANVPRDQLVNIEMEIDLLSRLNNPNIVKYHGHIKTRDFLYIVLEFVESGSLQHVLKSFGKFPESLAIGYISQVLLGLAYLHDQGVIHRDIKGANILTTKEGVVKLADFGVAVKMDQTARKVHDVVGSPFWIAPEVIELSGASPASDIWSMGCTVIELITGKPPYSDLAPMSAMYRIVQDAHPPIPEGITQELRDFLFKCFQKDVSKRETAKQLLNHPWISSAKKDNPDIESPAFPEVIKRVFKNHINSMSFTSEQAADALKEGRLATMKEEEHKSASQSQNADRQAIVQSPALSPLVQANQAQNQRKSVNRAPLRDYRISVGDLEQALRDLEGAFDVQINDEDLDIQEIKSQQSSEVDKCISVMESQHDEMHLLTTCEKLALLLRDNHDQRVYLMKKHGVMPILSLLQSSSSDRVVHALLQVINQMTQDNPAIQERVCLAGAVSVIFQHAIPRSSRPIRLECSIFIHQMCNATLSTLQMIISCRGIPVLVDLLEPDYEENKRIIFMAIDDIISSLMLTMNAPRKDFGRMYARSGLLARLVKLLHPISKDTSPEAEDYMNKIAILFLSFSNGDSYVKLNMTEQKTLTGIFRTIPVLSRQYQVKMLRVVKNLSTDPLTSENMDRASCVEELVKYISIRGGDLINEIHAESLVCLYNLCRLNPVRQEKIATVGAIKHLKYFYEIDSPLKSFALSILCDLVRASPVARGKLWEDEMLNLYLSMLQVEGWQVQAFESITTWLLEEGRRVEAVIQAKSNLSKLVTLFSQCSPGNFEKLLDPFSRILNFSATVNQALGDSKFVDALLSKLESSKTHVVIALLKMLSLLYECHKHPKAFISRYNLYSIVMSLKEKAEGSVVVQEVCNLLLAGFKTNSVI